MGLFQSIGMVLILIIDLSLALADLTVDKNTHLLSEISTTTSLVPSWPPVGRSSSHPVTRDTWISAASGEEEGSNGGADMIKLKGQQEYSLIDIDTSPLKGKIVTGALLHIRSASGGDDRLTRLGVSTIAGEWVEGSSSRYRRQKGSSCFRQAELHIRDWTYPGSTIVDATFGKGHTLWRFADLSPSDSNGWQTCAVAPDVVAARVAGLSHGFLLFDEVGSVWSLKAGKFAYTYFPNRFYYSRESVGSEPWMEIWTNETDSVPPDAVDSMETDTTGLPAGQTVVRWKTPRDRGEGKTLGFFASYDTGDAIERAVPQYMIPMAGPVGEEVRMHIRDLPLHPGTAIMLTVRPVDSAGNIGPPYTRKICLSAGSPRISISSTDFMPFEPQLTLPAVGKIKVAVVDLLDKIDPRSGNMIPTRPEGYKGGNHLFSAKDKRVRLQSARNETVSFQMNLEGIAQNVEVRYSYEGSKTLLPRVYQFAHVTVVNKQGNVGPALPDPLEELKGGCSIPSNAGFVRIPDQRNLSLLCELYVPHQEPPGVKMGNVIVTVGTESIKLDVDLTVWNFTLPDKLSFLPEMNAYDMVSPYTGYDYYRLAHEHRSCINRLPYGWDGLPVFAPPGDDRGFDWSEWDSKVGPLLDGSAFKDLPRKSEPVDVFYLPFSENWPCTVSGNYVPSYWADEAFSDRYEKSIKNAFAAFARHFDEMGWHNTSFQYYLNNKVYYRKDFNRSSAPWVLDEPINTQDFWALRWYGLLFHEAVAPVRGNAKMRYRADVSFGQFERNILWGITDVEYLGGNNAQKTRMKQDEQILFGSGDFAEYGVANGIGSANTQPVFWCIAAWMRGATGVLPWQTIGSPNAWRVAEPTALFYPHSEGPRPSVRLKAFTRGQQDAEYLTILSSIHPNRRDSVTEWLEQFITSGFGVENPSRACADTTVASACDVETLWNVRCMIGKTLSDAAPSYKRELVQVRGQRFDIGRLPDLGYVRVAPQVERLKPELDSSGF